MTLRQKYQQVLGEVTSLRDTVKVQAHLFSLDAKSRLRELESAMESAELTIARDGEEMAELAVGKLKRAAELGQQLFQELASQTNELQVPVSRVMTAPVASCGLFDSLQDATRIMWDCDCGAAPVVDEEGRVVGVITDRDVAMSAYLTGRKASEEQVRRAMSNKLVTTKADSTVAEVLVLMGLHQLRRLPVVDDKNRLLGMVSVADITRHIAATENSEASRALVVALQRISAPSVGQ